MRKFLSVIVTLLLCVAAAAQSGRNVSITLTDASTGEPLSFATVSLTPVGASKALKYVLTDENGSAKIEGVKKGKYTLKGELLGYKSYVREVAVESQDVALGQVKVEVDSQVLDAASVSAVGNPIIIKKDTVEYNASSFRTTDNDVLEDLLKKLPGVEVDSDGKITANGKEITKITIDGKTFFLDDPSIASKNIPAKLVEKVKVLEKKSEQAQFTGIDDGEEETVIDLSIKPGMMKGWFGNVMAGGGYDLTAQSLSDPSWDNARWQTGALVGRFTDKSQLSVIVNANNTNNRGFNDMAGSMMAAMRGGGGGMGRGAGYGSGNGITTSWMGGVNGAYTMLDGDLDLAGNYLYSGSKTDVREDSYQETYQDDGSALINRSNGFNSTFTNGHRVGIRYEHKFSEKTSLLFEPQFQYNSGHFNQYSTDTTLFREVGATDPYLSNKGYTGNDGVNGNWTASGFLLLRQRLNKPGRTISAMTRFSFSQNKLAAYNQSLNQSLISGVWNNSQIDQFYNSRSNSSSVRVRGSYTEPLLEKLFLEISYSYQWARNFSTKDTYNLIDDPTVAVENISELPREVFLADEAWKAAHFDGTYSNEIRNESQNHQAGATLQYQTKNLRLQFGAQYRPTITDNYTSGHDPYHKVNHNWSPRAMVDWDINDNADFRLDYRGNSSQPSTSQLMPVPDNSNPKAISFGNPYLNPYFNHTLRGRFGYTNRQSFFSIHGHFSASMVQDGIINTTWIENGVSYSMPMNGGLTGSANLGFFLNAPIGQSGFSISNFFNSSYSNSKAYVGRTSEVGNLMNYYDKETAQFDYDAFNSEVIKNDKLFADYFITNRTDNLNVTENLRATYRNDYVEVIIGGRTTFNKPWYTKEIVEKQENVQNMTWTNAVFGSFQYNARFGLGLKTDLNYKWYCGYITPQEDEWIWNAQISQLFWKNRFTLALQAYDILGQAKNLYVTDNANYHREVRNNTLGRYIMLSLTFRFGNFNKAGQQMDARMRRGGPGGPPPGR